MSHTLSGKAGAAGSSPDLRLTSHIKCAKDGPLYEYLSTHYLARRQAATRIRNHCISPTAQH
jgi:hypothetical protein